MRTTTRRPRIGAVLGRDRNLSTVSHMTVSAIRYSLEEAGWTEHEYTPHSGDIIIDGRTWSPPSKAATP